MMMIPCTELTTEIGQQQAEIISCNYLEEKKNILEIFKIEIELLCHASEVEDIVFRPQKGLVMYFH